MICRRRAGQAKSLGYAKVVIVLLVSVAAVHRRKIDAGAVGACDDEQGGGGLDSEEIEFSGGLLAALPFVVVTGLAVLPHLGVIYMQLHGDCVGSGAWVGAGGSVWVVSERGSVALAGAGYAAVFGTPEIYRSIFEFNQVRGDCDGDQRGAGDCDCVGGDSDAGVGADGVGLAGDVAAGGAGAGDGVWVHGGAGVWHVRDYVLQVAPSYVLVVAYAVRRMPYLVRSAAGGLQQTSVTLEEAAANLGASPVRVLFKITLPLILASLIAGGLLTFAFAMLEVSDSLILAQYPQHFPITKMIYALATDTSGPENVRNACALGVFAMMLLVVTIVSASVLMGKKLGAVFRA